MCVCVCACACMHACMHVCVHAHTVRTLTKQTRKTRVQLLPWAKTIQRPTSNNEQDGHTDESHNSTIRPDITDTGTRINDPQAVIITYPEIVAPLCAQSPIPNPPSSQQLRDVQVWTSPATLSCLPACHSTRGRPTPPTLCALVYSQTHSPA